MSAPLSDDAKKKILAAYKKFHAKVRGATSAYRQKAGQIFQTIDQKHAAQLKEKIEKI